MRRARLVSFVVPAALLLPVLGATKASHPPAAAAAQEPGQKAFTISAHKYAFAPGQLEVQQDDLVKITLQTEDIPHSFTIDGYRIAKRVNPGQTIVFEFRADQPGRFPFYCNLTIDSGCRAMRGELVVRPRSRSDVSRLPTRNQERP
jgi:heme/copper-type cytochrome/quinol oxidase subunit 2